MNKEEFKTAPSLLKPSLEEDKLDSDALLSNNEDKHYIGGKNDDDGGH